MMKLGLLALLMASAAVAEKPVAGLISRDDYPPEAMARGEQGTVKVKVRISKEGRPFGCTVIQGVSQSLDAATCYVIMRRARFKPANDEAGNAIEDDYEATVTWKIDDFQKENRNDNSTRMSN